MSENWVKKGAVIGIIWLVAGVSLYSAAGAQLVPKTMNMYDTNTSFVKTTILEKNILDSLKQINTEGQLQTQPALNLSLGIYVIASTSGVGNTIHLLLKSPHIKNSKGIFFAGVIFNLGLTAVTTVWKLTNSTGKKVVDIGLGPHVVVFVGLGYSTYQRNIKGGAGSFIGVSITKPLIFP